MTELKDLMRDMAARARTYDMTEKAIRISRRRRVVARTVAPALVAAAVVLVVLAVRALPTATPPLPPIQLDVPAPMACDLIRLQPPAGGSAQSYPTTISPNGRFVGGLDGAPTGPQSPVIWDNGVPRLLPVSGHDMIFWQVADNGDALGVYYDKPHDETQRSFLWRSGQLIVLKGRDPQARAFNSSWAVVGSSDGKAAIWRDPSKDPEFLRVPDTAWQAFVVTIDDSGQALGIVEPPGGSGQALQLAVWSPSGEFHGFARPAELGQQWVLSPIRFSNGEVVFWAVNETNAQAMLGRWDPRTNDYRMTPHAGGATQAVADNGWRLVHEGERSFVAGTSSRTELAKPSDTEGLSAWIYTMTDDGHTIVTSLRLRESTRVAAVMWRCR